MTTIYKVFLVLYLFLKPFYFFPSGNPQLADFVILPGLFLFFLSHNPLKLLQSKAIKLFGLFLGVTFIVNGLYATMVFRDIEIGFLRASLYYAFNFALFIFCIETFKSYNRRDFVLLLLLLLGSLLIQFLLVCFNFDKEVLNNFKGRAYNHFNNPNQLAYYALLVITLVFFIRKKVLDNSYLVTLCISIAVLLIIASTSFPAMLGAVLFLVLYFPVIYKQLFFKHIIVFIFPFFLFTIIKHDALDNEFYRISSRFDNPKKRTENSYQKRGYDRVFKKSEYLIFGAGEGHYERFADKKNKRPQEIHNTFLNILFSYGVIGFILFLMILLVILRKLSFKQLLYLSPIFFYNLVHNGIRFSLFWIVLALVLFKSKHEDVVDLKYLKKNIQIRGVV